MYRGEHGEKLLQQGPNRSVVLLLLSSLLLLLFFSFVVFIVDVNTLRTGDADVRF